MFAVVTQYTDTTEVFGFPTEEDANDFCNTWNRENGDAFLMAHVTHLITPIPTTRPMREVFVMRRTAGAGEIDEIVSIFHRRADADSALAHPTWGHLSTYDPADTTLDNDHAEIMAPVLALDRSKHDPNEWDDTEVVWVEIHNLS